MSIHKIFETVAQTFPKNMAVHTTRINISYDELNRYSNRLADTLSEFGLPHQSIIGLYMSASIEYVLSAISVLKSRDVFMPIGRDFPSVRLSAILERTRPVVVITTKQLTGELMGKLKAIGSTYKPDYLIILDGPSHFIVVPYGIKAEASPPDRYTEGNSDVASAEEDACYIMVTSGSTGEPKAILGSQKGLEHFISWEMDEFSLSSDERVSQLSPVTFDVSLRDMLVPLLSGGTLYIPDEQTRTNPEKLSQWLKQNDITLVHMIPTLFRSLTAEVKRQFSSDNPYPALRHILTAGEVLHWHDVVRWREAAGKATQIVNLYGPSETTLAKVFYRVGEFVYGQQGSVPIGQPIPGTKVIVRNEDAECSAGGIGEIYIATEFRSKGYYNAPELTSLAFIQNPDVTEQSEILYKTGDLGEILPDGNIRFIGRKDNQIKLNGVRIEIDEIESVLNRHSAIEQSAVVVVENTFGDKLLVAYIVLRDGLKPSAQSLKEFLAQELPHYMLPAAYEQMETMPLTHSGKIDRKALRLFRRTRPETGPTYIPPVTKLERDICIVWSQVLNMDKVGTLDNFFELGGSSLLVVRAVEMLKKELNIHIPIVKIFEYPQISLLAAYLTNTATGTEYLQGIQERAMRRRLSAANQRTRQ